MLGDPGLDTHAVLLTSSPGMHWAQWRASGQQDWASLFPSDALLQTQPVPPPVMPSTFPVLRPANVLLPSPPTAQENPRKSHLLIWPRMHLLWIPCCLLGRLPEFEQIKFPLLFGSSFQLDQETWDSCDDSIFPNSMRLPQTYGVGPHYLPKAQQASMTLVPHVSDL